MIPRRFTILLICTLNASLISATCSSDTNCNATQFCYPRQPITTTSQCTFKCGSNFEPATLGLEACVPCPDGSNSIGNNSLCIPCAENYYRDDTTGICEPCPSQVDQNGIPVHTSSFGGNVDASFCQPCTILIYDNTSNVIGCSSPSLTCRYGYEPRLQSCGICSAGTYSDNGQLCKMCDIGQYSSPGSFRCLSCPVGSQSNSNKTTCEVCPMNTQYNLGSKTCDNCPSITPYSAGGLSTCQSCRLGSYSFDIVPSFNGTTVINGKIKCLCPTGSIYNFESKDCVPCPVFTQFNVTSGKCDSCVTGTASSGGNTLCSKCDKFVSVVGTILNDNNIFTEGTLVCNDCIPGTQFNTTSGVCEICAINTTFNTTTKSCDSCKVNQVSSGGNSGCSTISCSVGDIHGIPTATPSIFDSINNIIIPGDITCNPPCENDSGKDSDILNCRKCTIDEFSLGGYKCVKCPFGTRVNSNKNGCDVCPVNTTYQNETKQCQPCIGFAISAGGTTLCRLPCSFNGTTQVQPSTFDGIQVTSGNITCTCSVNTQYNITTNDCDICLPGTQYNFNTSKCDPCAIGTVSTGGSTRCTPCPEGTSSTIGGSKCDTCKPGYEISPSSNREKLKCKRCPKKFVSIDGKMCRKCDNGEASNTANTACINCTSIDADYTENGMECRCKKDRKLNPEGTACVETSPVKSEPSRGYN
jgi:hypothetical protein